jgi:hypothetical protein
MNYCEVNVGLKATSPDDPRYKLCGKPARFEWRGTQMCAEHWDAVVVIERRVEEELSDLGAL